MSVCCCCGQHPAPCWCASKLNWMLHRSCLARADQPTALNLMYYLLYWFIVIGLMLHKWYHGTLTDRREAQVTEELFAQQLCVSPVSFHFPAAAKHSLPQPQQRCLSNAQQPPPCLQVF